jgi:methylated-DNA-protein-cysteine methyltransferase-like protein
LQYESIAAKPCLVKKRKFTRKSLLFHYVVLTGKKKGGLAMANSFERIYAVVKKIPRGTVASYGQVALLAGNPRWARVVGYALHANPDPEGIPCYRVVTKDGRTSPAFAFGGADIQRALLEADGIEFTEDGRVDMAKYGWTGLG